MNGLDLTPWIKENDGIHMPVELRNRQELLTNVGIGLVVAFAVIVILLVVCVSLFDKARETTGREFPRVERFLCFAIVLPVVLLVGGCVSLGHAPIESEYIRERQTESLESYIGDGYDVDLGCHGGLPIVSELPESHDGQKYDCRITFRNPDMTRLDNVDEQSATLLLRDNHAYLYDADGNLVHTVKE